MLKILALIMVDGATQSLIMSDTKWTKQEAKDFHAKHGLDVKGWRKAGNTLTQSTLIDGRIITFRLFAKPC